MPNANNKLSDYKAAELQNALMTNPTAAYFPWNCSDYPYATYPLGIPRANVLLAYQQKIGLDLASVATGGKGANFPTLVAPGIAPQWVVSPLGAGQVQISSIAATAPGAAFGQNEEVITVSTQVS